MSWTSSSNTFSNPSRNSLSFYIVFLIASQTKIFLHSALPFCVAVIFAFSTKAALTLCKLVSHNYSNFCNLCALLQSKVHDMSKYLTRQLGQPCDLFSCIKNLFVHSSSSKAFKVVCVLRVYQCLLGPPRAELQPLLCSVNWTFGYKRLEIQDQIDK